MPPTSDQAPRPHWLLGHARALLKDPLALLDGCSGGVVPLRLGKPAWLVLEPADVLHVLENSDSTYSKGRAFRFGRRLYGNSLLVSEGRQHRQQARQVGAVCARHAEDCQLLPVVRITRHWLDRWSSGDSLELWSSILDLALAISSRGIFGDDYLPTWLSGESDSESAAILDAYDIAMGHVATQNFSLLPIPDWIPTPANRRYARAIDTLDHALAVSVERRMAGRASGGLLDHLLALHRDEPETFDLSQIRDQSLTLLLGGYESTATALCWTLFLLSRHGSIRDQVRQEIRRVDPDGSLHHSQASSLELTGRVFSEAIRLYPPPWLIPRTAIRADTLPSGHHVRSNAQIFLSPYRTQRDERFFERPLEFDPGRFDDRGRGTHPRGSYFPFGLGPRQCLGESIGRRQAVLVLATILRHHDIDLLTADFPRPHPLLTLRPASPLPVRIEFVP